MSNPLILKLEQRDRLSNEERRVLEGIVGRPTTVARGQDMVREGERPTESKLLLDGFDGRYKMLRDGKRQITAIHISGDFVDLHSLVLKPMDHAVVALTDCRVVGVPHDVLRSITEQHPHLARLFLLNVALDGAMHRQWIAEIGRAPADSHFAHLICELFLRLQSVGQAQGNRFQLPLTQAELGDVLGLSTVHVNRTLQVLRGDGLVSWHGSEVEILDWDRLCALAEFDATYLNFQVEPR